MVAGELYYEIAGEGKPVVLLHPGFADSRIWDPQWPGYAERFRVVRCDMPGFGQSPIRDLPVTYALEVAALLDRLAIRDAAMVGCSLGGRVALELAIARPDLVSCLVLIGAATPDALATASEMTVYTAALMDAIAHRDLEAAVAVNVRTWVVGPFRKPEHVDPDVRAKIALMQHDAFINTRKLATSFREELLVPALADRLSEIVVPSLIVVGQLDLDVMRNQAHLLADRIQGARLATLPNTAHTPSIERPETFDDLVVPWLASSPP